MKLLTNSKSWTSWIKEEEGRFADHAHQQPKKYPCFAYMQLESWGQETQRALYLYQEDLEAMTMELMAAVHFK